MIEERSQYKIIFYGTPDFAEESLKALDTAGYNILSVVTVADKSAGRGRKLRKSPVKIYAENNNLPLLQPKNLKSPDFLRKLEALKPDLQVVVAFRILPDAVINAAKDGTVNLHASLLPQYRGAAPINHAIMQGEKITGITTFFIDSKIDTGAVIHSKEVSILEADTAGSLHDKLKVAGAELLVKTADDIMFGRAEPIPQDELFQSDKKIKKAPKLFKENCYVNFKRDYSDVYNFIRGLAPYPGARIVLRHRQTGKALNCLLLKVAPRPADHTFEPDVIDSDNKNFLKIAAQGGFIEVLEIKAEGKKAMDIKSFLNGFDINSYILE